MNPIQRGIATDFKPIRGNMKPPRKAKLVGVDENSGAPIYKLVRRKVTGRRVMKDAEGNAVYHTTPDGRPTRPRYEAVVTEVSEEFIQNDAGNGMVRKVRNFRPSAEEIAVQKSRAEEASAMEELRQLARVLRQNGITANDLADVVRGGPVRAEVQEGDSKVPAPAPLVEAKPGDNLDVRMERVKASAAKGGK